MLAVVLIPVAARAAPAPSTVPMDAAGALPVPPAESAGVVPLSSPMAPVPAGMSPWELSVSVLGGVADPFYGKVATWLSARRGFGDVAVELFGGRAFSWSGPALGLCTSASTCTTPTASQLGATPGNLGYLGGVSAVWRLAQGKVSVSGLASAHFALEVSGGAAAVQYSFVDTVQKSVVTPGGRVGVGLAGAITNAFSLRLDFQDIIYPTDIRGDQGVQNQLLAGVTFAVGLGGP
jgi:outer membrane beta-barrel protein